MFLLEIVTLGIYRLYFLIKTRREMMNLNPHIKIKSPALLFAPFILIFVAVIVLIATVFVSTKNQAHCLSTTTTNSSASFDSQSFALDNTGDNAVAVPTCTTKASPGSVIGLLLFYPLVLVGVVLFVIWEWSYAHGVEIITNNRLGFALSLIILIVVPDGIDILIIQDYFNKVGETPVTPGAQVPPPQAMPPATTVAPPTNPMPPQAA